MGETNEVMMTLKERYGHMFPTIDCNTDNAEMALFEDHAVINRQRGPESGTERVAYADPALIVKLDRRMIQHCCAQNNQNLQWALSALIYGVGGLFWHGAARILIWALVLLRKLQLLERPVAHLLGKLCKSQES